MSESDPLGLVGQTIDDLRFDECVDTEGKGLVYRGHLKGREEPVAIKCLSLSRLGATEQRGTIAARFNEETKILTKLGDGTHDIVHCLSSGRLSAPTNGETVQYQVLEWLNGRTLKVDLDERRERGMPGRSLKETLDMIESAALALGHAHSQGIVHRDVQPANLMLVRSGVGFRLKVLDFGLAKILGKDAPLGAEMVTDFAPEYAAPEQRENPLGEIGPWTDVYSLALIVLEVMAGKAIPNPTSGGLKASAFGVQAGDAIEGLLARATAADPHARPVDAKAFWNELRELSNARPVANQDALAATALDADAAAAIARVRALTATPQPNDKPKDKGKGTMLMPGAPPQPQPAIPIQEGPLAGTKPIAIPSPLASSIGHGVKTPVGPAAGPNHKGGTAAMPQTAPQAPTQVSRSQPPVPPAAPSPRSQPPGPPQQMVVNQQKSPWMIVSFIGAGIVLLIMIAIAVPYRQPH